MGEHSRIRKANTIRGQRLVCKALNHFFRICHIALDLSHITLIALYPFRVVADQWPRLNCKVIVYCESVEVP